MARLVCTGWETGDEELNGGKVSSTGYNNTITNSQRRTGTYSRFFQSGSVSGGSAYQVHVFSTDPQTIYFRFAFRHNLAGSGSDSYVKIIAFHEGGNEHFSLAMNWETLSLGLYVCGTLEDTDSIVLSPDTWNMIEGYAYIADTSGEIVIKVNGTTTVTFTGDTCNSSNEYVSNVRLGPQNTASTTSYWYDDFSVNDDTGTYQNSYVGLGGTFYLKPTADGYQNDWTPSTGSDNYAMVDDIPPDNATTYVQAVTTGDIDSYEISDCPQYIDVIHLVQVVYQAALVTSGYNELTDQVYIAGTAYDGTENTIVPITPDFQYYLGTIWYNNPNSSGGTVPWGTVDVNGMEAGMRITV